MNGCTDKISRILTEKYRNNLQPYEEDRISISKNNQELWRSPGFRCIQHNMCIWQSCSISWLLIWKWDYNKKRNLINYVRKHRVLAEITRGALYKSLRTFGAALTETWLNVWVDVHKNEFIDIDYKGVVEPKSLVLKYKIVVLLFDLIVCLGLLTLLLTLKQGKYGYVYNPEFEICCLYYVVFPPKHISFLCLHGLF